MQRGACPHRRADGIAHNLHVRVVRFQLGQQCLGVSCQVRSLAGRIRREVQDDSQTHGTTTQNSVFRRNCDRGSVFPHGLPIIRILNSEPLPGRGLQGCGNSSIGRNRGRRCSSQGGLGGHFRQLGDFRLGLYKFPRLVPVGPNRQRFHLGVNGGLAVFGVRVTIEKLGPPGTTIRTQFREEVGHFFGVITRLRHQVRTQRIGIRLRIPRELQEDGIGSQADTRLRQLPHDGTLTSHRPRHAREHLQARRLRSLVRSMPQNHMGQFMSHYPGQLRFIIHRRNQTRLDEHRATGERESVDRRVGHQFERERKTARFGFFCLCDSQSHFADVSL